MKMYADILAVGIPASLEQLIMAILAIIVNFLLTVVAGTTAVAVYTAGWRIISVGIIPAVGVGTAAVTVAGYLMVPVITIKLKQLSDMQ